MAGDILDYHSALPPIDIRLNRSAHHAYIRLHTLPDSHPLHPMVQKTSRRGPRFHRSRLHELALAFPNARNVETIDPGTIPSTWTSPCTFRIAKTKDEALAEAEELAETTVCVFTDGSGFRGEVGASAVIVGGPTGSSNITRRHHLGSLAHHTVFEGELLGTVLAIDAIREAPRAPSVTILLDNQAAIRALQKRRPQPGQYLVDLFYSQLGKLFKDRPHTSIHIAWVPGHCDNPGNEAADAEAKLAAEGDSLPCRKRIQMLERPLPTSSSALKAGAHKEMLSQWKERWESSDRGARFARTTDKTPPRMRIPKFIADLPRRQSSILVQLRSGHVGLNVFLHRIRAAESPLCVRCQCPETVEHYLIHCRRFVPERVALRLHVKTLQVGRLLTSLRQRKPLLDYIRATERFPKYNSPLD